MEGTAELFGTHRFDEQTGRLTLRIMPRSREEVPMLGRIKLIRDAVAAHQTPTFAAVLEFQNRGQPDTKSYAWCWAAAKFLDTHPRYRDRFRGLARHVLDPKFNEHMRREYDKDWPNFTAEWQAYVATLDHGFDFERMAIEFTPRGPSGAGGSSPIEVAADRGWQSTGVRLAAGKSYRISATGRYQITAEQIDGKTLVWPCEPGGVTIEYHDGRPLGILLGAIQDDGDGAASGEASFAKPATIGQRSELKPKANGMLFLRVNDSPAHLGDNRGTLSVTVTAAPN
jgi:hypothetical protein